MKPQALILIFLVSFQLSAQDTSVKIITQDVWPPGKNVPVTIEITRGDASGFARFYHDFPQGFTVQNVVSSGADYFWDNMQVNYVWLDLPDKNLIVIQYLARADESLAGSFKLSGRFDYIADGETRVSIVSESHSIKLDRSAEVEAVEEFFDQRSKSMEQGAGSKEKMDLSADLQIPAVEKDKVMIDFRVQVSIASQRFTQAELEERIGSKLEQGIKVLKTGNMFKYHSGSFRSYEEAAGYLNKLKANGVEDAFIVAFEEGTQISINMARSKTEK